MQSHNLCAYYAHIKSMHFTALAVNILYGCFPYINDLHLVRVIPEDLFVVHTTEYATKKQVWTNAEEIEIAHYLSDVPYLGKKEVNILIMNIK